MEYAQLNADGSFGWQVNTHGNVEWDATHFCPASKLTPEEAEMFRVVPFTLTPQPAFDPITQLCFQSGGEFVDGHWRSTWTHQTLPDDQIAERQAAAAVAAREAAKAARQAAVEAIKVTTAAGNTFDGDETSQTRMSRAIIALGTGLAPSVNWVLADNSVIQAPAAELTEALVLAGQAQAAIWVIE